MAFATARQVKKLEARVAALEEKLTIGFPVPNIENILSLHDVFGDELASLLSEAGYSSVEAVMIDSDENLRAVSGIGPATVKKIRELIG